MKKEITLTYPAKIKKQADGYVVNFRDLPNIFTEANSYEQALINAQDVLDILLLDMAQDEFDTPNPSACRRGEIPVSVAPEVAVPVLLHKLRKQKHYTQANVADAMGVSYQTYQQIEMGKNITLRSLKRAAAALGAIVEIKLHFAG